MDICIYCKYMVKYKCEYSYINEYGDFSDGKVEWVKELDGYELFKLVSNIIKDQYCMRIKTLENSLYIEDFDPNTGETGDYIIYFEEIEDKKED